MEEELYKSIRNDILNILIKNKVSHNYWQGICDYIETKYQREMKKSTLTDTQNDN